MDQKYTGPSDLPKLLTVKEAATFLNLSPGKTYTNIRDGKFLPGTVLKFGGALRLRLDRLLQHTHQPDQGQSVSFLARGALVKSDPPRSIEP